MAASVLSIRKQNDCSTRLGRRAFQYLIAREPQRVPDCSATCVIRIASRIRVSTRLSAYDAHALNGRTSVAYVARQSLFEPCLSSERDDGSVVALRLNRVPQKACDRPTLLRDNFVLRRAGINEHGERERQVRLRLKRKTSLRHAFVHDAHVLRPYLCNSMSSFGSCEHNSGLIRSRRIIAADSTNARRLTHSSTLFKRSLRRVRVVRITGLCERCCLSFRRMSATR